MESTSNPLKLRQGDYLVVARDHPRLDDLKNYQLLNGFLVPKEVKSDADVNSQMVTKAMANFTYLAQNRENEDRLLFSRLTQAKTGATETGQWRNATPSYSGF
jgi:hypothetical protein